MKSGMTLALAMLLGAAAVMAYWLLKSHSAAVPDVRALESGTKAMIHEASTTLGTLETGAFAAPNSGDPAVRGRQRDTPAAGTPLGAALVQGSRLARGRALFDLAEQADIAQLRSLLAQARTLGVAADRRDAVEVLLLRWFELDPRSAPGQLVAATLAEPASPARGDHLASIARAWAQLSAPEAWTYAARIADPAARIEYETTVLAAWGEQDPEGALRAVLAAPGGARKDRLLRQAAANLALDDPQRAIELATSLKRADARPLFAGIVAQWAQHDVAAAAQWLAAHPGRVNRNIAVQLADRYGAVNPLEALGWAQKIDRSGLQNLVGTVLAGHAESDPQDALRMAIAVESGMQRSGAIAAVLGAIAERDPAFALENFDKVPEGAGRDMAVRVIARSLVRADPRAAIEWFKQLQDHNASTNGIATVGMMLAEGDPDMAASLLEIVPADARMPWIASVANGMLQSDPTGATRWLRSYQSEPGYGQVAGQFAQQLGRLDPHAAFEFAASINDPHQRDQVLRQMMYSLPLAAPEVAARALDHISDERLRANAAGQLAAAWGQQDPAAARKWVTSLESGPARDQALTSMLGNMSMSLEDTTALLGQMQSAERRMEAVSMSAMRLSRTDLDAARTLIRRYPLDPRRRDRLATHLREQYGITL